MVKAYDKQSWIYDSVNCGKANIETKHNKILISNSIYEIPEDSAIQFSVGIRGHGRLCSGTLISFKHILTSAHCITNISIKNVDLIINDTCIQDHLNICTPSLGRIIKKIHKVYIPQDYNLTHKRIGDIAVLEINNIDKNLHHVCLPIKSFHHHLNYTNFHNNSDISKILFGFGLKSIYNTTGKIKKGKVLRILRLPNISGKRSGKTLDSENYTNELWYFNASKNYSIYHGDSGGGNIANIFQEKWFIYGVTKGVISGDSHRNFPKQGFCINVIRYVNFIENVILNN
uniref:Peptidase S1 domain-containing protein n=1 Tax=Parastrongyloides trichosuri TaxID=131310 RepID=A0A0N4ZB87_PARTI